MQRKNILIIAGIILVYILYSGSVFVLDETEQAIVTQFGRPVGELRTEPGVNFKLPFIQKKQIFDKRYLEWDGDANQVPTRDKKFIFVDSYARWVIIDPLQFYIRLKDERQAQSRLDDILDGETRNAVASNNLLEIVRSTNRKPEIAADLEFLEEVEELQEIKVGKEKIEQIILEKSNERTADLGIRILDFRFKRLNYVEEVRDRVYDRMISERKRIASRFRSEGEGEASRIQGDKQRDLAEIQSVARREAEIIRGAADSTASAIYAAAYNKNSQSKAFYSFLRSTEALKKSLDEKSSIILTTDNDLYRLLKEAE